jgi:hypothetical protein
MYGDIKLGQVDDLEVDMYCENARVTLFKNIDFQEHQLHKDLINWIYITSRLNQYEYEMTEEEYNQNAEVKQLWTEKDKLPDFERDECWCLLNEDTRKVDKISMGSFSYGRGFWSLKLPCADEKNKSSGTIFKMNDRQFGLLIVVCSIMLSLFIIFVE